MDTMTEIEELETIDVLDHADDLHMDMEPTRQPSASPGTSSGASSSSTSSVFQESVSKAISASSPKTTLDSMKIAVVKPKEPMWYACSTCHRAFTEINALREHMKLMHKITPGNRTLHNGDNTFITVGAKTLELSKEVHMRERHLNVLKSKIHGKGLFSSRFIPKDEIIIEYTGEFISRNTALRRQNEYDINRIEHYIMKVGKIIIDATVTGNCSKYINNSCDPNCNAELIEVLGKNRVLVMAARNIMAGEELTYDYQFTSDELIPCNCGAKSCRRFLNCNVDKLNLNQQHISELIKSLD